MPSLTTFFAAIWLTVAAQTAIAQTLSTVPAEKFRDLTMPFDSKMMHHFFGPAGPPTGEEVVFQASGVVIISLNRGATLLPAGATVVLTVLDAAGRSLATWPTELNPVTVHGFIRRVDLPVNARMLSVRVVDKAEGGPTGNQPYTLVLEAWPAAPLATLQVKDSQSGHQVDSLADARVTCNLVGQRTRRSEYVEALTQLPLEGLPTGIAVSHLVTAGGYLSIGPLKGANTSAALRVRLFAKPSGDGPFTVVCPHAILHGGEIQFLEATSGGLDQYSIWRVELDWQSRPQSPSGKASVELVRERVLVAPDPYRADSRWNNGRGLICFDQITQRLGQGPTSNPFAGRTKLNVTAPSTGSIPLTDRQRTSLERAVLQAASLWVHACVVCNPDNLSAISINGKLFIANGLFELVSQRAIVGVPAPVPAPAELEDQLNSFLGTARVGIGTPFLPYREVSSSAAVFQRICAIKSSQAETPTLHRIQRAVCAAPQPDALSANVRVSFKAGETGCGDDPNIIGCWADHELTQYNVRDYRFVSEPDGTEIGYGAVALDLLQVVLHEMGHWIGLDHIENSQSIMASSLEQARCIDYDTVWALAKTVAFASSTPAPKAAQPFLLRASKDAKPHR